jgi:hypothetical protein
LLPVVSFVEGALYDHTLGRAFTAGSYACHPPGMPHGRWTTQNDVTMPVVTCPEAGPL